MSSTSVNNWQPIQFVQAAVLVPNCKRSFILAEVLHLSSILFHSSYPFYVLLTHFLVFSALCSLRILLPVQRSLRPRTTEPPFHAHAAPPAETELFIPATAARLWPGLSVLTLASLSNTLRIENVVHTK